MRLGVYMSALWYIRRSGAFIHCFPNRGLTRGRFSGEGGPFALYQGIYPPKFFQNTPTHDSLMAGKSRDIKPPVSFRWPLLIWVILFLQEIVPLHLALHRLSLVRV